MTQRVKGPDWKALLEAFVVVFTASDLEILFRVTFDESLGALVGPGAGSRDKVVAIFQWVEQRSKWAELLGAARDERPDRADFGALCNRVLATFAAGPSPVVPPGGSADDCILEVVPVRWADPRTKKLLETLLSAYTDVTRAEHLARDVGVDLGNWNKGSPVTSWRSLLEVAAAQGLLRALVAHAGGDPNVRAFHPALKALCCREWS